MRKINLEMMSRVRKSVMSLVLLSAILGVQAPSVFAQETEKGNLVAQNKSKPLFYPIPHEVKLTGKSHLVKSLALPEKSPDAPTLEVLKQFSTDAKGTLVELVISPKMEGMHQISGAYAISFDGKKIKLTGYDDIGLFYAAQSLLQMLEAGKLPEMQILDWPDVEFRGTVEGFYGKPWEFEDRVSQLKFYGKYKLNSYIYGPKNDPFHGFSTRWREFYPAEKAEQMKKLVQVAKDNKVNFIWALHPGRDIKWGEPDRLAAIKKFQHMYDLGVRSFAVFFDDIGGEGAKAEGQVEFLNYVNQNFIKKKSDCTPLIMCPTQYWGGGGQYHDILGEKLDKDIRVMWTGKAIVSDITLPAIESLNKHINRKAFIWWNFPVTDYVRHAVFLGRVYGVEDGTIDKMSGFVSNPMDKPEASKVTLFSIADLVWNSKAFDSETSWKNGISILFPTCSEAMQTFANHNSDGGKSFHNYRKEESVNIQKEMKVLMEKLAKEESLANLPEAKVIQNEFKKIEKAAKEIPQKVDNKALLVELEPWLVDFANLGKVGQLSVSVGSGNFTAPLNKTQIENALEAGAIWAEMDWYSEMVSKLINKRAGDNWQKSVKTGGLLMRPFVEEVLTLSSPAVIESITGKGVGNLRPYNSSKFTQDLGKMIDSDPNSIFYCKEVQKEGDFFGLDLGKVEDISKVRLVMGRNDKDLDIIHKGQLEYSIDGKKWEKLLPQETTGFRVEYQGEAKKGRFVRYRATTTGVPGGKKDVWTAIRDFKVNAAGDIAVISEVDALKKLSVEFKNNAVSLAKVFEVYSLASNQSLGIAIPDGLKIGQAEFNLKTPNYDWAKVEVTKNGKTWEILPATKKGNNLVVKINQTIKGVRVLNSSDKAIDIGIENFKLSIDNKKDEKQALAFDGSLRTSYTVVAGGNSAPVIPLPENTSKTLTVLSTGAPTIVEGQNAQGAWVKLGEIKGKQTTLKADFAPSALKFNIISGGVDHLGIMEILVH